jgi:hypothetical protein
MEFFEEQGAVLRQMISSLRMGTERSFSEVMRSSKSVSLGATINNSVAFLKIMQNVSGATPNC